MSTSTQQSPSADDRDIVEAVYRFLLSRRWFGFAAFVVLLAGTCVWLGTWQLDRHDQRAAENARVEQNMSKDPVALRQVQDIPDDRRPGKEWQPVRVTGTYDTDHQVVVKYQTRRSQPGVEVVTPLVTESGRAVLVDRGWMESENTSEAVTGIPEPPDETVTVEGWWRPDSTATGDAVEPTNAQVRAISSAGMAEALSYPVFDGYINLLSQNPAGSGELQPEPRPDMGQGPHFFYAMQWFFFAGLAVFGWFYLAWSEAHPERRSRRGTAQPVAQRREKADVIG